MSRDIAGKAPQRLSKFSKAGDEAFRVERARRRPIAGADGPEGERAEAGSDLPIPEYPGEEDTVEIARRFSRFAGERYPQDRPAESPGLAEPVAAYDPGPSVNPYRDVPDMPVADHGFGPGAADEGHARLVDELDWLRRNGEMREAEIVPPPPSVPAGFSRPAFPHLRREAPGHAPSPGPATSAPRTAPPQQPVPQQAEEIEAPRSRRSSLRERLRVGTGAQKAVMAGFRKAASATKKGGAQSGRLAGRALKLGSAARTVVRVARAKTLRARYRMTLAALHTHLFDRKVERLLFVQSRRDNAPDPTIDSRDFRYQGAIPHLVLNWAFSALPEDLKSYAFVDFRAGNGRTMLLAARRNFEVIYGYAFGAQDHEDLDMNIAQYPRSLMTCRDLRAMRGDVDGISIPEQPCVLFFPDSGRERHLGIMMSHIVSSFRLNPRPLYLIFDKAEKDTEPGYDDIFEPVPIPLSNRVKLALFSPERVKVYRAILVRG